MTDMQSTCDIEQTLSPREVNRRKQLIEKQEIEDTAHVILCATTSALSCDTTNS